MATAQHPCEDCGSSNGVAHYNEEGTDTHCFVCSKTRKPNMTIEPTQEYSLDQLPFGTQNKRKISAKIAEMFGVKREVTQNGDASKVYYPYFEKSKCVGYKVRMEPKDFRVQGKLPATLFGQNVFSAGGKRIIVTEGEEDALAIAEAYQSRGTVYPVVSIPSASNIKAVVENREYLRSFEEVILFIDNDEAGEVATEKLASVVGYDKVKIAKGAKKDASDIWMSGNAMDVLRCIWDAQPYTPQSVLTGESLWEKMIEYNNVVSVPYPKCLPKLNDKLRGMRMGEIALWVSGTGAGKSTLLREIVLDLVDTTEDKIGIISLEESPAETTRKMAGMAIKRNSQLEDIALDDLRKGFDTFKDRVLVLDHCGSMADGIISQLEYMALSGCKYLFIDHITILVSEGAEGLTGNEAIDKVMNDLLRISKQHNVWIGLVSHLRKLNTPGKSFEEGHMPTVDDIRGSGSIKQISHDIIAFSRNITAEDEEERNQVKLSVLKSRFTGNTGPAGECKYDAKTGRLLPSNPDDISSDF